MRISFLTNEYPPDIYGGAGVHADHLSRAHAKLDDQRHRVHVLCFGDQREDFATLKVEGVRQTFNFPFQDSRHQKLLDTLYRNILMTGFVKESDIVH